MRGFFVEKRAFCPPACRVRVLLGRRDGSSAARARAVPYSDPVCRSGSETAVLYALRAASRVCRTESPLGRVAIRSPLPELPHRVFLCVPLGTAVEEIVDGSRQQESGDRFRS